MFTSEDVILFLSAESLLLFFPNPNKKKKKKKKKS